MQLNRHTICSQFYIQNLNSLLETTFEQLWSTDNIVRELLKTLKDSILYSKELKNSYYYF